MKQNQKPKRPAPALKLYWVSTPDGDEDWFLVARSKRDAERDHEVQEGYDIGYATAELICRIPDSLVPANPAKLLGNPSNELIEACGGVRGLNPPESELHIKASEQLGSGRRVFHFGEKVYGEGDVFANALERLSQ